MGDGEQFFRDVTNEFLLNFIWCVGSLGYESESMADAEYMGIDGHGSSTKPNYLHDVGCFPADSRQTDEVVER